MADEKIEAAATFFFSQLVAKRSCDGSVDAACKFNSLAQKIVH